MITNYDLLVFLIADGGHHSRNKHLELLSREYPELNITLRHVLSLRASMLASRFITADVIKADRISYIRVTGVDEKFRNYSLRRPKDIIPNRLDSYLLSEPDSVVRTIKLRMELDSLLRGCHEARNGECNTQCGTGM